MLAFEIIVNAKRLCIAGTEMSDVLGMGISWARRESGLIRFNVGGLVAGKNSDHFAWKTPSLRVGDEIVVRLVDVDTCDEPELIYNPASDERQD